MQRLAGISVLLLAGLLGDAGAAGLQVTPILVEFVAGETAQVLRVSNASQAPLRAQVRVLAWTQSQGQERLQATREVVASPPIMELPPGQEQLVRVLRLQADAVAAEKAYRLWIDELPAEAEAGKPGVQFLLRHSVPLFVLPPGARTAMERRGKPDPGDVVDVVSEAHAAGEQVALKIANRGVQRVRVSQLSYIGADGQSTAVEPGLLGYVLAGQEMQWTLRLAAARLGAGGTFKARLNDDPEPKMLPAATPSR